MAGTPKGKSEKVLGPKKNVKRPIPPRVKSKRKFLTRSNRAFNRLKRGQGKKRVCLRVKTLKTALNPIFSGKRPISLGFRPSREFSTILREIYEAQIEGSVGIWMGH